MEFYDFNTHSLPEGSSSPSRLALTAKKLGFQGIAITNHQHLQPHQPSIQLKVYAGIEITGKPRDIHRRVSSLRKKAAVIAVHGGREDVNRAALETPGVDILCHPYEFNHILARMAAENMVAIEFNIHDILHTGGARRAKILALYRQNLKLTRKYETPMILTSGAMSHFDLRAPREMAALAGLFGMEAWEAKKAMSQTPLEIIKKHSPNYILRGVEIL